MTVAATNGVLTADVAAINGVAAGNIGYLNNNVFDSGYIPPATGGALVRLTANDASPNPINWDAEVYDNGGWHDNASNNSRFTCFGNDTLVRLTCNMANATTHLLYGALNGASVIGNPINSNTSAGATEISNCVSAPITMDSGQYMEILADNGSAVANERTWGAIEALSPTLKHAIARRSGTTTTIAPIPFNDESIDTDGFHDNVTNPERLTVVSGVTLVKIAACIDFTSTPDGAIIAFQKNGAGFEGQPVFRHEAAIAGNRYISATSPPLEVTTGDYFTCFLAVPSGTPTVNATNFTWFCIEECSTVFRALVTKNTGTQNATTTPAVVTWDQEIYDTHSIHDNVTNNSRLTVPSGQGITEAKLSFNLQVSGANTLTAVVIKNGSEAYGLPACTGEVASADDYLNGVGAWVPATGGDYFELQVTTSAGTKTISADSTNWFCLECR